MAALNASSRQAAGAMLLHRAGQRPQRFIHLTSSGEFRSDVRIKCDNKSVLNVTRRVLVRTRPAEVVFREHLFAATSFTSHALRLRRLLHSPYARDSLLSR